MLPPTSCALGGCTTAGISDAMPSMLWEVGTAASSSREITRCCVTFCVSTSGVRPETVIVSSIEPSDSSMSTVAVKLGESSRPSRRVTEKPGSV